MALQKELETGMQDKIKPFDLKQVDEYSSFAGC